MSQAMLHAENWRGWVAAAAIAGALAAGLAGLALSEGAAAFWHGFIYNGFSALPSGFFIC